MADVAPPCDAWFGRQPVKLHLVGSSGFSGSRVFRVDLAGTKETFILKSFGRNVTRRHAEWVHRLMRHLRTEGILQVPAVYDCLRSDRGALACDMGGALWELAEFMPGAARGRPTVGQASAAAEILARMHVAAAALPGEHRPPAPSPGLLRRCEQARALLARPWRDRCLAGTGAMESLLFVRMRQAIGIFERTDGTRVISQVAAIEPRPLTLQPVLRDVWSEHVLFADGGDDEEEVTAFIDYHAAGIDTPATDLARLFGSWSPGRDRTGADLLDAWSEPLAAYERVRPLVDDERRLVPLLDATGVIFGLDNWFRWTLEEHRDFQDAGRVLDRIDRLLADLEQAIGRARDAAGRLD